MKKKMFLPIYLTAFLFACSNLKNPGENSQQTNSLSAQMESSVSSGAISSCGSSSAIEQSVSCSTTPSDPSYTASSDNSSIAEETRHNYDVRGICTDIGCESSIALSYQSSLSSTNRHDFIDIPVVDHKCYIELDNKTRLPAFASKSVLLDSEDLDGSKSVLKGYHIYDGIDLEKDIASDYRTRSECLWTKELKWYWAYEIVRLSPKKEQVLHVVLDIDESYQGNTLTLDFSEDHFLVSITTDDYWAKGTPNSFARVEMSTLDFSPQGLAHKERYDKCKHTNITEFESRNEILPESVQQDGKMNYYFKTDLNDALSLLDAERKKDNSIGLGISSFVNWSQNNKRTGLYSLVNNLNSGETKDKSSIQLSSSNCNVKVRMQDGRTYRATITNLIGNPFNGFCTDENIKKYVAYDGDAFLNNTYFENYTYGTSSGYSSYLFGASYDHYYKTISEDNPYSDYVSEKRLSNELWITNVKIRLYEPIFMRGTEKEITYGIFDEIFTILMDEYVNNLATFDFYNSIN